MVAHSRTSVRTDRVRALNLPSAVEVAVGDDGLPTAIVEGGRTGDRIAHIVEAWRMDDEWWRQPIHRRYVEVVLERGAHVVLFEDEVTNEWFVQMP